jgi:hypothetical protein
MADTKISGAPAVVTPVGTDELPLAQSGASKKITLSQIRKSLPTLPSIVSVGAEFSSTGAPTATLPGTHAANDILVLCIQQSNESNYAAPTGYTRLGPQNGIGAAATAGSTKLCLFWKRDNGSESAPTLTDSGDHTYGVMFAVRGCPTSGDPFWLGGQAFKFTASTTGTAAAGATTVDNCLVVNIFAHAIDNASAQGSSPTNADLTNVTEQFDDGTTDGTGGGIYIMSGTKATRGPFAGSTVTWASSTVDVSTTIIFVPEDAVAGARPVEVQTFIGSPSDLDDTWVKPSGAVYVRAQTCDGGQSGSGGNTTTTAAGGGGGGGGGYDEAFFRAADLAATVTVHAGRGGAAGTALNQAGNLGVVSEFGKGDGFGPLIASNRTAGTAATAAASADGGNGGCGAGKGSAAVETARLTLSSLDTGTAMGARGAAGGSGTTAPVGGSEADWGGGGGESGGDTDAGLSSANNGNSMRGGGGGSGGRTNTNISGSGRGGGAAGVSSAQGAAGADSARLPYGGSGGVGGGSSVPAGGSGGFPGGGGGGGGGVAGGFGGRGGHGCVVVTTFF